MAEPYSYIDPRSDVRLNVGDDTGDAVVSLHQGNHAVAATVRRDHRRRVAQAIAGDSWRVVPADEQQTGDK